MPKPKLPVVKPSVSDGKKTTEFFLTVAGVVLTTASTIVGSLPVVWAAPISAALIGLYNIGRVVVKSRR